MKIEGALLTTLVGRMKTYQKVAPIQAVQIHEAFDIATGRTIRGEIHAQAGSWLAYDPESGAVWAIPDEVFQRTYRIKE